MPNGVPLSLINAGKQEVVRMDIIFKGGRFQQSYPLQALFTNRMLREGSRTIGAVEIAERLDYYGAWLELSSSADYSFLTLYSLNRYFKPTLAIVESLIKEPLFPQKELSTVIDNNRQHFMVNSAKVDFVAQRTFLRSVFGAKHPMGYLTKVEDYAKISPEMLKEFYADYYHSGNCSIYLAGCISDEIIRSVESTFGHEAWGDASKFNKTIPFLCEPTHEKRIFVERADALQSSIKMGMPMISRTHPDYLSMRVLMTLFGGYFGSRLMSNIREDKGYTYGISSGILCYPDCGIFMIATEADNEYAEPIVREVYAEMDKLRSIPVSEDELTMVRNYMLGDMCRTYEGPFSLAEAWIFIETSHLEADYFQRSLEAVTNITAAEIKTLAEKYFHKEPIIEVIAGKKV
ncbi:MAG: pitrilysin family protein [Bacteroides sp.]